MLRLIPIQIMGMTGYWLIAEWIMIKRLELLQDQAILLAQSGADVLAPSDMMDGRVKVIRNILESNGFVDTVILSYAAKYASSFYGPFREAVGSAAKSW